MSRLALAFGGATAGAAAALAIAYALPPVYRAKALLQVGGAGKNSVQTQAKLLRTGRLPGRVADKLHLDTLAMARHLTVSPVGETQIVELAYEGADPQTAAAVANALADEYVAQTAEKQPGETESTRKLLSDQLQDLKSAVDQAERDLEDYDPSKIAAQDARLQQLQAAYRAARESRIADQSRYETAAKAPLDAIDDEAVRLYRTKFADLQQQLAEARAIYTPAHYKVRELQAQAGEMQQALEGERQAVVSRLRSQLEASRQREQSLQADLEKAAGESQSEAAGTAQYDRLKRALETYSRLYEDTLRKVKEADLAPAPPANGAQVVESAVPPASPVRPNKPLYAALGALCGLLFGCAMALHRDRRARLASAPGDCARRLGIPELGLIPCASLDLPYTVKRSPEDEGILRNWLETVTWRQRGSRLAEAYRGALASLMKWADTQPPCTIVFTSAGAGEGTTTVVTNLAIALAETGRRVLLIDAVRRSPRLHEVFRRPNRYGLSEYLASTDAPDFGALTQSTHVPGLSILPAGLEGSCAPGLEHNRRMAALFAAARQEFDAVLVDAPPLQALSGAHEMARMADGIVLVIRAGAPGHIAPAACERLRHDGIRVLGTILNGWKRSA